MGEALGRDLALGFRIALAVVMNDAQALAREQGVGDGLEVRGFEGTGGEGQDADAARDFLEGVVVFFQQLADAFLQGPDVRGEQAGLQAVEEMVEGEQGMGLGAAEPQARQFMARGGGVGVVISSGAGSRGSGSSSGASSSC